jgi:hypothetical protein
VDDNTTFGTSNTDTVTFTARVDSEFSPATDNAYDLGRTGHEWRDLFIDGTANIDSLIADTADINAGSIDGTTIGAASAAAATVTTLNVTSTIALSGSTGTSSYVLTSNGASAPTWEPNANGLAIVDDTTTNAARYLTFTSATTGNITTGNVSSTKLQFNPSTGVLTSTSFTGAATGLTGTASININGTVGATTANTGAFTTLSATGVTTVQAGTASDPAITTSGDTNTGIFFPAADTIAFAEGGVEAMRIDSSGNLLVGTTSNANGYRLYVNGGNDRGMQLDAPSGSGVYTTMNFAQNGAIQTQLFWFSTTDEFQIQNTSGGVKLTNGATSWASASDERLKDIIEPITNAAEKVSSLRAVIGKYKTDADGKRRAFLIAQDVQAVLPEAVYSAQQARSEDETEYLNLQYTDTIPLLVAAIQELKGINDAQAQIITALTARVEALEGTQP